MESIKKIIVDELEENHPARAHGYKYNVRIFTSVDGGKKFYYCGVGRYCKKANAEVKKALTDLYKTTIQPAERAKAANNQNLVCYFRGVRNALAAVGIELGFNITNGEDFDK